MPTRIPLAGASGDEILSRVTYQIILGDYELDPTRYDDPAQRLLELALEWHQSGLHTIAAQLDLCGIWCAHGGTIATWLKSRILFTTERAPMHASTRRGPRR